MLQYDPASVTVVFAGKILDGYADGTFVSIERNSDSWALKVGADGKGTRVRTNDRSGKVTLTLMQSSAANDILSGLASADELTGKAAAPLLVRDGSGRTVAAAATAWIVKPAPAEFSKEASTRAWVFETDILTPFIGGN